MKMRRDVRAMRVLVIVLSVLTWVGPTVAQNPNSPVFPATIADDEDLPPLSRSASDFLNGAINDTTLTIVVDDASEFTTPALITIDSEVIQVCSVATNTFTVCTGGRGFDGTTAVSHSDGVAVIGYLQPWHFNQLAEEIKALESHTQNTNKWEKCYYIADDGSAIPATEDYETLFAIRATALTLTEVYCQTDTGTLNMNLTRDDGTAASVLSADLVCDTNQQTSCASGCDVNTIQAAEDNWAVGDRIDHATVSVSAAQRLSVCLSGTVD